MALSNSKESEEPVTLLISSLPGKALRTLVDIARLADILRILGECLLISSLPGKTSRTIVDTTGSSDSLSTFYM